LLDVVPTILDLAGVADTGTSYQGHDVAALEGRSLLPAFARKPGAVHDAGEVFADEVNDIRYVRKGPWKMTRIVNYMLPSAAELLSHDWQLYDIDNDRGETTDVAAQHPDVVAELTADWAAYAHRVNAVNPVLPPILTPIDQ